MKEITVQHNKIHGILYRPSQLSNKLPAIILISGSDGGIPGANAIPKNCKRMVRLSITHKFCYKQSFV